MPTPTYRQVVADGSLVDEGDVAVRDVGHLLGAGRDVAELLRVLLLREAVPSMY